MTSWTKKEKAGDARQRGHTSTRCRLLQFVEGAEAECSKPVISSSPTVTTAAIGYWFEAWRLLAFAEQTLQCLISLEN